MELEVHHQTDHVLQTVGKDVIRYMTASKKVPQLGEEVTPVVEAKEDVKVEPVVEVSNFESYEDDGQLVINIKEGKDIYVEFVID